MRDLTHTPTSKHVVMGITGLNVSHAKCKLSKTMQLMVMQGAKGEGSVGTCPNSRTEQNRTRHSIGWLRLAPDTYASRNLYL